MGVEFPILQMTPNSAIELETTGDITALQAEMGSNVITIT